MSTAHNANINCERQSRLDLAVRGVGKRHSRLHLSARYWKRHSREYRLDLPAIGLKRAAAFSDLGKYIYSFPAYRNRAKLWDFLLVDVSLVPMPHRPAGLVFLRRRVRRHDRVDCKRFLRSEAVAAPVFRHKIVPSSDYQLWYVCSVVPLLSEEEELGSGKSWL